MVQMDTQVDPQRGFVETVGRLQLVLRMMMTFVIANSWQSQLRLSNHKITIPLTQASKNV
jgi:hypothetical protein